MSDLAIMDRIRAAKQHILESPDTPEDENWATTHALIELGHAERIMGRVDARLAEIVAYMHERLDEHTGLTHGEAIAVANSIGFLRSSLNATAIAHARLEREAAVQREEGVGRG